MGPRHTGAVGERAEDRALQFLIAQGLRLVTRNFRRRDGEIDLVMLDGDCLAFVEVRYRRSAGFTHPGHSVDRRKQRKIVRTAARYLAGHPRFGGLAVRFDVVAMVGDDNARPEWLQDAFRPDDVSL